jgi:hypothetical protein
MAFFETFALTLGASIAKAMIKSWAKDGLIADVLPDLIDLFKDQGKEAVAKYRDQNHVTKIGEQVAERMKPFFENEAASMSKEDRTTVVREVAETLAHADINAGVLVAHNLEADSFGGYLITTRPQAIRDLSAAQSELYKRMLAEAGKSIIDIAIKLDGFTDTAFASVLQDQDRVLDMLSEMLKRPDAMAEQFERDYRQAVQDRLDRMELFGVPRMDALMRWQSLTVAYVTLQCERRAIHEIAQRPEHLSEQLMQESMFRASQKKDSRDDTASTSIDHMLTRSRRLVIRADAGSGKTTLLQWIAVHAANQDFPSHLAGWNDSVPYLIRLRERVGKEFPQPHEFPLPIARNFIESMPQGWVQQQLRTGRAIVLVDGVDELPVDQRSDMLRYLAQLVEDYPLARYIITSRPAALKTDQWPEWAEWINESGFLDSALLPMDVSQIENFIDHWHTALKPMIQDPEEREELEQLPETLKRLLRRRPQLRRLATNPLLCAMLCALHRERRSELPAERIKLYDECVEMLLERRDIGRKIAHDPRYPPMTYAQKLALIQSFAYWMMQNEYSDVEAAEADAHFTEHLPVVNLSDTTGDRVRAYFVERSSLLREPVEDRISFTHRTFQEFLAAQAALNENSIGVLLKHARDDQWRELIILAAGKTRRKECDKLLTGLIDKGNRLKTERHRHQLHLLAVACLETAVEVSPHVRQLVLDQARALFPPKDLDEAKLVAAAGDPVVPLLSFDWRHSNDEAIACVRALALIGGDKALDVLVDYARHRRPSLISALGQAWESFDRIEYARRVLDQMEYLHLKTLSSWEGFEVLSDNITKLRLEQAPQINDLQPLMALSQLSELHLSEMSQITDLSPLAALPNLTQLGLSNMPQITDFSPLAALLNLTQLSLSNMPQITDLSPLAALPNLTQLDLSNMPQIADLSPLAALLNLTQLSLTSMRQITDLSSLTALPNLSHLSLYNMSQITDLNSLATLSQISTLRLFYMPQLIDLNPLAALSNLSQLSLFFMYYISDLSPLAALPNLAQLTLSHMPQITDLNPLAALPNLIQLHLSFMPQITDLSALASLSQLSTLRLSNIRLLTNFSPLAELPNLSQLSLSDMPQLTNLSTLPALPNLTQLRLDDLPPITNLSPLVALPNLTQLHLYNMPQLTDLSPLLGLSKLEIFFNDKKVTAS